MLAYGKRFDTLFYEIMEAHIIIGFSGNALNRYKCIRIVSKYREDVSYLTSEEGIISVYIL